MNKLDERGCLQLWIAIISEDRTSKYTYENRKNHIDKLMEMLLDNDIDQDTAQMLKNKVVEALVTKDGMKGNGKHKNWKENTQDDFDNAIQMNYVLPKMPAKIKPLKGAQGYDPRIVKWAKEKFGDHIGEEIIIAAHQPMHTLWMMFMNDYHKRDTGGIL